MEEESGASPEPIAQKQVICRNWAKTGSCRFGERCHFKHAPAEASQPSPCGGILHIPDMYNSPTHSQHSQHSQDNSSHSQSPVHVPPKTILLSDAPPVYHHQVSVPPSMPPTSQAPVPHHSSHYQAPYHTPYHAPYHSNNAMAPLPVPPPMETPTNMQHQHHYPHQPAQALWPNPRLDYSMTPLEKQAHLTTQY